MSLARDLSVSAATAGFVTVRVGFASSATIVFQAAGTVGVTPAQGGSWMPALGVRMGPARRFRGLLAGVVTLVVLGPDSRRG